MELKTKKGELFLIDDEDYDLIKHINWSNDGRNYIRGHCNKLKKTIRIHQLILDQNPHKKPFIDHINRNTFDNRKINLRFCSRSENAKNRKASGNSKYLGVFLHTLKTTYETKCGEVKLSISKGFLSKIVVNGKQRHLGRFKSEIDAAKCYNEAAIKYHGEFAILNTFD